MLKRIIGLLLVGLLLFLAVSLGSFSPDEGPHALQFPQTEHSHNLCGAYGAACASFLFSSVGFAAYALLIPLLVGTVAFWLNRSFDQIPLRILGFGLILCAISTYCALVLSEERSSLVIGPGGYLGASLKHGLSQHFAATGCYIFLTSLLIAGLILTCEYTIIRVFLWMFGIKPIGHVLVEKLKQSPPVQAQTASIPQETANEATSAPEQPQKLQKAERPQNPNPFIQYRAKEKFVPTELATSTLQPGWTAAENIEEGEWEEEREAEEDETESNVYDIAEEYEEEYEEEEYEEEESQDYDVEEGEETVAEGEEQEYEEYEEYEYALPGMEFLTPTEPFNYEVYESTLKKQAALLEKSFQDFGFNIRVVEIQTGPVISQFEIQLERGLRLNKIQNLTEDLAVALKVSTVRIVAPIPGKNTVGVEIPNENRQIVRLREVIEETTETAKNMQVPIFLGKDVSGTSMVVDLSRMPHLLIAGRTGTGKSVCLNSIIVSMLMTRTPEQVRMILIDPKVVEMNSYKSIPHLMHPVVTDMRRAEAILGWAVEKMEERYQLLGRAGVKQLSEYNNLTEEELYHRMKPESLEEWDTLPHSMPYMVIIVDELNDLMMSTKEAETHIIRLAQKSRAVGIHLVLATQKPTVDVVTGLIKSNLPARIAFGVASRVDSQVILDRIGAEKLLGYGDMLFLEPGTSQVIRGQGTFVSNEEIEALVAEIGTEEQDFAEELLELKIEGDDELEEEEIPRGKDALYEKCVEFLIREGRGSLSLLQRRFSIGYNRAARIMDRMAAEGV
ncbi:MAG: DNA translocase FtsK, partial [Planctomycetaceae bacterium]|nr:DNA translocase FtsK [Planctomycetaceae bacterium]